MMSGARVFLHRKVGEQLPDPREGLAVRVLTLSGPHGLAARKVVERT